MNTNEENEGLSGAAFEHLAEWMKKNISPEELAETSADPLRDIKAHLDRMKTLKNDVENYYTGPPVIIIGGGGIGKHIAIATHMAAAGFHTCGPHEVQAGNLEYAMDRFAKATGHNLTELELIPFKSIAEYTNDSLADILNGLTSSIESANSAVNLPKPDFSKLAEAVALDKSDFRDYNTHKKVEHFENKTLGAKIGGRKHKKNPFNFRR